MGPFLRFYRPKENKELLINVNSIWKIEVTYAVKGDRSYHATSLKAGMEDPDAVRIYLVFAGAEEIRVIGNPDDPVVKVLEELYKSAVKA